MGNNQPTERDQPMNKKTKTTTETRIECTDWNVAISDKGFARKPSRKLLTKGTTQIAIPDAIYERLCAELKAGNEVCFAADMTFTFTTAGGEASVTLSHG